jgi:hypothetical protein
MTAPRGLPDRVWLVIWPNGERHVFHKEPLEGMAEWSKGVPATVAEYRFEKVTHVPPPPKKKAASKT